VATKTADLLQKTQAPEGMSGDWRIEHFSISKDEASFNNMRMSLKPGQGSRWVKPGNYTRLMCGRSVVMSDTRAELADHSEAADKFFGDVLINGLGLGIITEAALRKDSVSHVTVVEKSMDVISLVEPYLIEKWGEERLVIIRADAMTYKPPVGSRFDAVWHDIWTHICADNLTSMKTLHRRYGNRACWQGSWCRHLCEMHA